MSPNASAMPPLCLYFFGLTSNLFCIAPPRKNTLFLTSKGRFLYNICRAKHSCLIARLRCGKALCCQRLERRYQAFSVICYISRTLFWSNTVHFCCANNVRAGFTPNINFLTQRITSLVTHSLFIHKHSTALTQKNK